MKAYPMYIRKFILKIFNFHWIVENRFPIIITLLTALLARQQLPLRVWFAIFLGFIGVTLILRPEAAEFQLINLLPLFAALLYASAMVITSLRCKGEDPLILTLALNIALILLGAILGLFSGTEQLTKPGQSKHLTFCISSPMITKSWK